MATKKISELTTLTTPESDDLIAIVDASATETKKITYGNISKHIVNVGTEVEEDSRVNVIHSRNIIDSSNFQSGAYSMSTGNYTEYGTRVCTINKIPVEPSTKYAITMNTTTSYSFLMIIDAYSEDGTYLGRISANNGNTSGTYVQTQATAKYINITMRDTTDSQVLSSSFLQYLSNGSLQIQLVKGETSLDYEPYTQNQIVVDNEKYTDTLKVGTDIDNRSRVNVLYLNTEISAGNLEQGGFTNAGLPQDNATRVRSASFIATKPNTSYSVKVPSTMKVIARFYNTNTSTSESLGETTGWVNEQRTFTTPSNGNYIKLLIGKQNDANITPSEVTFVELKGYVTPSINVDGEMLVSKNIYSTSEVVIGEWFGKPLYRKVYSISNPSSSNTDYVDLTSLNIDRLVHLYGYYKRDTGTFGIPFHDSDENYSVMFLSSYNRLRGRIANASGVIDTKIIIEYTKTTD